MGYYGIMSILQSSHFISSYYLEAGTCTAELCPLSRLHPPQDMPPHFQECPNLELAAMLLSLGYIPSPPAPCLRLNQGLRGNPGLKK